MNRVLNFLRWANMILILATFLSYIAPWISPVTFWPISLFGLAFPWLALLHLVFIVVWIFFKKWYFLFSVVCLLLGWHHITAYVSVSVPDTASESLVVLSHNAHGLSTLDKGTSIEAAAERYYQFIAARQADVICIQEFYYTKEISERFLDILQKTTAYKYTHFSKRNHLLIASIYPIRNQKIFHFEGTTNGAVFADIEVRDQTVRVYNLHLQSNKITSQANQLAEKTEIRERKTWTTVGSMLRKMRTAASIRAIQAEAIRESVALSPHPVIVCGDFNDTPVTYTYRTIQHDLQDTFREKGNGFGITFSGSIPFLRIDYILVGDAFEVLRFNTIKYDQSDHYPIKASLWLRR